MLLYELYDSNKNVSPVFPHRSMATTLKFTNAWLKNINLPKKDRDEYRDADCPGLLLRVTASGIMTFSHPFRIGKKQEGIQ